MGIGQRVLNTLRGPLQLPVLSSHRLQKKSIRDTDHKQCIIYKKNFRMQMLIYSSLRLSLSGIWCINILNQHGIGRSIVYM